MKKYINTTKIALLTIGVVIAVIVTAIASKPQKRTSNKSAYAILQEQKDSLSKALEIEKKNYKQLKGEVAESLKKDSTLKAQYEQRILRDYYTIQALNKKKNEKIKIIDTASDSLLRAILADY